MTHDYLFNQIADELPNITGWCPLQKALDLAAVVVALRPKVVCELGVWSGRSFLPMAMACKHLNHGLCVAVDPWTKEAGAEGYDEVNAKWWRDQDFESILRKFSAHVQRLGLESFVQVQRAKSDDAVIPEVIDLISVDGQHTEQASADVKRWTPHVRIGGVVCMDDIGWTVAGIPTVKPAVDWLLAHGFTELSRTKLDTGEEWGFFQRVSWLPISLPTPGKRGSSQRRGAR